MATSSDPARANAAAPDATSSLGRRRMTDQTTQRKDKARKKLLHLQGQVSA